MRLRWDWREDEMSSAHKPPSLIIIIRINEVHRADDSRICVFATERLVSSGNVIILRVSVSL
jgi:hypothetical protein